MEHALPPVDSLDAADVTDLQALIGERTAPIVIRALVNHWPVVEKASVSDKACADYLKELATDEPVVAYQVPANANGRVFYNDDMSGFNFTPRQAPLGTLLDHMLSVNTDAGDSVYVGSTLTDRWLPEFRRQNSVNIGGHQALVSLWIGTQCRIAAHYDFPDNLACCIAGTRRFTLMPPEQIHNLYVGPVDVTPAGQAISMVDYTSPDFERYPRFRQALDSATVAELNPGDALFIPSMWWHQVDSTGTLNGLINYWWRSTPAHLGNPTDVLHHALLSVRSLPEAQRQAWRDVFDYYVFGDTDAAAEHIPPHRRGPLGDMNEMQARRLRAQLLNKLNR